jgi:hypothetical protein
MEENVIEEVSDDPTEGLDIFLSVDRQAFWYCA